MAENFLFFVFCAGPENSYEYYFVYWFFFSINARFLGIQKEALRPSFNWFHATILLNSVLHLKQLGMYSYLFIPRGLIYFKTQLSKFSAQSGRLMMRPTRLINFCVVERCVYD